MTETPHDFLIIPCGGTTTAGVIMRRAVLRIIAERPDIKILDLAPFLAGLNIQKGLLDSIPLERRIAMSGCTECCPFTTMRVRGIPVGHRISVNEALSPDGSVDDMVQRVYKILG